MINTIFAINIPDLHYYIISGGLGIIILVGIFLLSKVENARLGNAISGVAFLLGVILSILKYNLLPVWLIYIFIAIGTIAGLFFTYKTKMIQMPQLIALLNGLGGLASMIIGGYALDGIGAGMDVFSQVTSIIAIVVGGITFSGSVVAALKLHQLIPQKSVSLKNHYFWILVLGVLLVGSVVLQFVKPNFLIVIISLVLISNLLGILFTLPIGGADMPIVISLLNSLSGLAAAISGLAITDFLLVLIGGIVGASGLLLTQIMAKAMNRRIFDILFKNKKQQGSFTKSTKIIEREETSLDYKEIVKNAKDVIIVPGYGMAIAQAQHLVKQLADILTKKGKRVRYAIHPVAGRMPGHMNVLLAEANVGYDSLFEMTDLNDEFKNVELTIVVGANDVLNPAARTLKGSPIYDMPILNVDQCKNIFIFNYDLKPGYAGVDNPLYESDNVITFLGNAFDTLKEFIENVK